VSDKHGRLLLDGISHRYGRTPALSDITLSVEDGEFLGLLGPSGCGKTTLLRIVAGFVRPSQGRVLLGDRDMTALPPHLRPLNTVFQRPSLFPHLDVGENVAFGLRLQRLPRDEVVRRVREVLGLVRLEGYERRRSHELSGGQMQRVALARVLVKRPQVLLLDEPLSALDLAIRLEMEAELRRVHRETGATFVYVTHDQREAMALSDRIVVLNQGRIEQVGTPERVYRAPASAFAARFVGDANVIAVEVLQAAGPHTVIAIGEQRIRIDRRDHVEGGPAWLVLRPETVFVSAAGGAQSLRGVVRDFAFRGTGYAYRIALSGVAESIKAEVSAAEGAPFAIGAEVNISWDTRACSLLKRMPPDTVH
jgi:ABC-type Fe3+/spermidine/putrescine transport system ATPase subunit